MEEKQLNPKTADTIFESVKREEDFESDRAKQLDQKAISVAGFSGLIASVTIGMGGIVSGGGNLPNPYRVSYFTMFLMTVLAFLVAMGFALRVLFPKQYYRIKPEALGDLISKSVMRQDPSLIKGRLSKTHLRTMEIDRQENLKKIRGLRNSYIALAVGLAFLLFQAILIGVSKILN